MLCRTKNSRNKSSIQKEIIFLLYLKKVEDPRQKRNIHDLSKEEEQQLKDMRPRKLGNKNAEKQSRKINLGWVHGGKQVKLKKGGGTKN